MQIGDKVKFINESLEGVITRLIDDKTIGVSVEDGFEIPVLKREIMITTPVNLVEKHDTSEIPAHPKVDLGKSEISVWFEQSSQTWFKASLVNNSGSDILVSVVNRQKKIFKPLFGGRIEKRNTYLFNTLNLSEIDEWGTYCFRIIFHESETDSPRTPWYLEYTFKPKDFTQASSFNGKATYLIPLKPERVELFSLKQGEIRIEPKPAPPVVQLVRPEEVVDLHLEFLSEHPETIPAEHALNLQVQHFQNFFEKAIALNYRKITFIHGVGQGILKQRIWKTVSGHPAVKTFREAQKEKFGYGATEILFK